ncbi:hypothetical protein [Rhodococcus sp. Leaf278]|nr:hypothetical protein [Rhodococcus sp. Leaf278]
MTLRAHPITVAAYLVERGDWSASDECPEVYLAESGALVVQHPFAN